MNEHTPLKDDLHRTAKHEPESGHDVWAKDKIERALREKKEGRATYKPLRDIAAKYEIDAS
jgi:hypothetical protein